MHWLCQLAQFIGGLVLLFLHYNAFQKDVNTQEATEGYGEWGP